MKKLLGSLVQCLFALMVLISKSNAQITISAEDFPADSGTLIITKNSIVDSIVVDIGFAGENQMWHLDQEYPAELHRQLILPLTETPYGRFFPESDIVTRYVGNLGNFIDSYYFENTVGTFYLYQKKTPEHFLLHGIAFDSATVNFGAFRITYSGHFKVQPKHPLFEFPLEYHKSWQSISNFSMNVDTLLGEDRVLLVADVRDSVNNIVDGWGHVVLPTKTYECLRVKSDIVLNEKLFLNGLQIRSKTNRVVNYYWLHKDNGIVAKVSSFLNPESDDISLAKRFYRLYMFNPQISFAVADTIGEPGDYVDVPIHISDPTDMDIRKIYMCVNCDTTMIEPVGILKQNSLIEGWHEPNFVFIDSTFQVELSGDAPLTNGGVLCYLRVKILQTFVSDTTAICLGDIKVDQAGPKVTWQAGRLIINAVPSAVHNVSDRVPSSCRLFPNFPNPFNESTTITFQLLKPAHVRLLIYNSTGQLVFIVADQSFNSGEHRMIWQGIDHENRTLPSGIYFYRFEIMDLQNRHRFFISTGKMMLLR